MGRVRGVGIRMTELRGGSKTGMGRQGIWKGQGGGHGAAGRGTWGGREGGMGRQGGGHGAADPARACACIWGGSCVCVRVWRRTRRVCARVCVWSCMHVRVWRWTRRVCVCVCVCVCVWSCMHVRVWRRTRRGSRQHSTARASPALPATRCSGVTASVTAHVPSRILSATKSESVLHPAPP
jgi:hypothetical protein